MLSTGCNETSQNEKSNSAKDSLIPVKVVTPLGKKFFVYDEILHYRLKLSETETSKLLDIENETKDDSLIINIIFDRTPVDISDTSFIKNLEKFGYLKKSISKEKFAAVDSIFIEKTAVEKWNTNCVTIFRNILLFKIQNKTIGIAKICFGCGKKHIVGTTAKTEDFGYNGDYRKLESLLKN